VCGLSIFIPNLISKVLNETATSFLILFGCGIFISVALMHMMPEASEAFEAANIGS